MTEAEKSKSDRGEAVSRRRSRVQGNSAHNDTARGITDKPGRRSNQRNQSADTLAERGPTDRLSFRRGSSDGRSARGDRGREHSSDYFLDGPDGARRFQEIEAGRARLLEGLGTPKVAPFVVDEFQQEAIASVCAGFDTLVVAPTGAGKTFIAFEALDAAIDQGKRGVYTTPLKALSNTKYNDLRKRFAGKCEVGLLTGDRKIDSHSAVVVATTEIYRNELYREPAGDALVILDEVHFISDPQRGPVWEESIILTPSSSVLLMLSASISNAEEIARWIEQVRGRPCKIVTKEVRPVELRFAFLHPDIGVIPLRDEKGNVFKEVEKYYTGVGLDHSGMKLRGGNFSKPKRLKSRSRR